MKDIDEQENERKKLALIINRLFADLQAICSAWRVSLPGAAELAAAKRQWVRSLWENGIHNEEQLQRGLRRARREADRFWPCPSEFIRWCEPDFSELGLPTPEMAYQEACHKASPTAKRHKWSHPAVYVAASAAGLYELSTLPACDSKPMFLRAYEIAVRRVITGEDLNAEIPKFLPGRPKPRPVSAEVAIIYIESIKKMFRRRS